MLLETFLSNMIPGKLRRQRVVDEQLNYMGRAAGD